MAERRKKAKSPEDTITIMIPPREPLKEFVTIEEMRDVIDTGMLDLGLWLLAESLKSEEDSHIRRLRMILRGLDHSVAKDNSIEDGPHKQEAVISLKMASEIGRACEFAEYNIKDAAASIGPAMEQRAIHRAIRAVRKIYPTYFAELPARH